MDYKNMNSKIDLNAKLIEQLQAVNVPNEENVNTTIKELNTVIKRLMFRANMDEFIYIILQQMIKILTIDPNLLKIVEKYNDSLQWAFDGINFEKETLINLREYLKKQKDCNDLMLVFKILMTIDVMQECRNKKLDDDSDIIDCARSHIQYIPSGQPEEDINECKLYVKTNMEKIKK